MATTSGNYLQDRGPVRRAVGRLGRHGRWATTEGLGKLIEEDQLRPVERVRRAVSRARWRRTHGVEPGTARPVFLVGVQRSGTNMVVRGFERSPEFEVHNENSRRAFARYELRDDDTVRRIVAMSRHRFVLFKPLCDSHRIGAVMDGFAEAQRPHAIWAYRAVDGRVRSAVSKFGDVNLRVMREIAEGGGVGRWQRAGLTGDRLAELQALDWDHLGREDGAALFWYVRNCLFFDTGLAGRPDVSLVSYESLLADPHGVVAALCDDLGMHFRTEFTAAIERRHAPSGPTVPLRPEVRALCDDLHARLEAHRQGLLAASA